MLWKKGRNKEECSWCERALFAVTCKMGSLETPIHLPNFGQLNKLWEKLYCHCCEGWSFLIELTACFDPVNVIRKKETIAFKGAWVMRQVETPKRTSAQRLLVNATGDFCTLTLLKFFPPNKGHYFILEYISYNNWLFSSNIFSQQG